MTFDAFVRINKSTLNKSSFLKLEDGMYQLNSHSDEASHIIESIIDKKEYRNKIKGIVFYDFPKIPSNIFKIEKLRSISFGHSLNYNIEKWKLHGYISEVTNLVSKMDWLEDICISIAYESRYRNEFSDRNSLYSLDLTNHNQLKELTYIGYNNYCTNISFPHQIQLDSLDIGYWTENIWDYERLKPYLNTKNCLIIRTDHSTVNLKISEPLRDLIQGQLSPYINKYENTRKLRSYRHKSNARYYCSIK